MFDAGKTGMIGLYRMM